MTTTRFLARMSRAAATKPSPPIKRVAPLTSFCLNASHTKSHHQQSQTIGPGRCYDRTKLTRQIARDRMPLLSVGSAALTTALSRPGNEQQHMSKVAHLVVGGSGATSRLQTRFLQVGPSRSNQAAGGNDDATDGENVLVTRPRKYVASLELNTPKTKNAFGLATADEFVRVFRQLDEDSSVRCVLLSGRGDDFTSGVDIKSFMGAYATLQEIEDVAHRAFKLRSIVERFQAPFKAMHAFGKPIICIQHGLSLGLAMELAACSDIRLCSRNTRMAIREVLIGIAADVGSLQLMPRLVANQSLLSELIYTGRYITMEEALNELKFVSRVCETKEAAMAEALDLASTIASRSPVAVQGSKRNLRFSREQPFETGLDYNAVWNAAMMQGGDVIKAIGAVMSKQTDDAEFDDL